MVPQNSARALSLWTNWADKVHTSTCQRTLTTQVNSGAFEIVTIQMKPLLLVSGSFFRSGFLAATWLFSALRFHFIWAKSLPHFVVYSLSSDLIFCSLLCCLFILVCPNCVFQQNNSLEWIWAEKRRAFHLNLWKPLSPCMPKWDRISRQPQHFQFSAIRHWGDVSTVRSYSR